MDEYISREELIKALETDYNRSWCSKPQGVEEYVEGARDEYDDVLKIICSMAAADVQPVKHGRWIDIYEWAKMHDSTPSGMCTYYWCSECQTEQEKRSNSCPHCGARMDGDIVIGGENG